MAYFKYPRFSTCLGMDAFTTQSLAHKVHEYIRHRAASMDAWKQDKLRLKYVRRFMIRESLLYKDDMQGIAPSVCCSNCMGITMPYVRRNTSLAERDFGS